MSIYSDLLFHQGHIADVALARSLAARPNTATPPADAPETTVHIPATDAEVAERQHRALALMRRTMTALSPFR
ncbi:hypothetical protein [Xanthomonas tesorieronis]|uniref:hypothetical protein n=1 Tax=Xanthomonas tesorieronis TaxID=3160839 RepID=UPI0035138163